MKKTFNILGIPGSLRRQSYNLSALRAAQQLAPEGVSLKIFDLNDIPGFNEDHEKNLPPKIVEKNRLEIQTQLYLQLLNIITPSLVS